MKKKIFGIIIASTLILTPFLYVGVASAKGLVPDCGTVTLKLGADNKPARYPDIDAVTKKDTGKGELTNEKTMANPCNFNSLMELINNIIHFLLFVLATPLVVIILAYAGFKLITSGGSSEGRTKVKHMIFNVIIGYIIALVAWIIIHSILVGLGADKCTNWLGNTIPACETK